MDNGRWTMQPRTIQKTSVSAAAAVTKQNSSRDRVVTAPVVPGHSKDIVRVGKVTQTSHPAAPPKKKSLVRSRSFQMHSSEDASKPKLTLDPELAAEWGIDADAFPLLPLALIPQLPDTILLVARNGVKQILQQGAPRQDIEGTQTEPTCADTAGSGQLEQFAQRQIVEIHRQLQTRWTLKEQHRQAQTQARAETGRQLLQTMQ